MSTPYRSLLMGIKMVVKYNTNRNSMAPPISLAQILTPIFRYKWLIILFFCGIVGVVVLGSLNTTDTYRANAKFIVEKELDSEKAMLLQINVPSQYEKYDWINAEIEIIKSYPVALRVVEQLNLSKSADSKTAAEPEPAGQGVHFESKVKSFQRKFELDIAKNSNVIEISYQDSDPVLAARVVKTVIDTYVSYRSELYDESETYKFFEEQIQITDDKVRNLERDQSEFKRLKEMISPEAQRSIFISRLSDFEKRLSEVQTNKRRKTAILNIINDQFESGDGINLSTVESNEIPIQSTHVARLRSELLTLELERERMLQNFTEQAPQVVHLQKQIDATETKLKKETQQIIKMIELDIRTLAAEESILEQSIRNTSNEIRDLAQEEYEYLQISRGVEENREIYSMLLKQREEARISLAKLQNGVNVRVISPAVVPANPINPRTRLKIAIAVILGVVGGLGLVFFRNYLDHTFTFPDEIEHYTNLTVMGSVRNFNDRRLPNQAQSQKRLEARNVARKELEDVWIR